MNTKRLTQNTVLVSAGLRHFALLTLLLHGGSALSQSLIITNIVAPGSPFAVTGLSPAGHVAGYYFLSETEQRAFSWLGGTSVDLGALGGSYSVATSVNGLGTVVGQAATTGDSAFHAFASSASGLVDLGTLGGVNSSANHVGEAGHVVGQSEAVTGSGDSRAFMISPGSLAMLDLGTLGGTTSSANRVNSAGQVIGDAALAGDAEVHAFLYGGGTMRDLGSLGGGYSTAFELNENGLVVGRSTTASGEFHGFLFDGTAMLDLGTLGGTYSSALAVNNAGDIIGDSTLVDDVAFRGFVHRNGVMTDLSTLGGLSSSAWAINSLGQIVGTATDANEQSRAFLWENGVMTDLNTLLSPGSDWLLTSARFINDSRQVVGEGVYQGQPSWFFISLAGGENHSPVADGGSDQSIACGTGSRVVTLDGSASSDPDGEALSYLWLQGDAVLGNTAVVQVSFADGAHQIVLRVTDPHGATAEDTVLVVVGTDTLPPVLECPVAQTLPANDNGRARVPDLISGLVASDNCTETGSLVRAQTPAPGSVLGCGVHTVVLTVTDSSGNRATCTTVITVADVSSPVVRCLEDVFRRARTNCLAAVPDMSTGLRVRDNCTPRESLVITQEPVAGTLLGVGVHPIRVTVTDAAGNATNCVLMLHVLDLTRPIISSITPSTSVLRPANRQMVPVSLVVAASDNCDPNPRSRIVGVSSSERDGNGVPDWRVTGDLTVELRAEITSNRGQRIYQLLVACSDASGNTTYRTVQIRVSRQ